MAMAAAPPGTGAMPAGRFRGSSGLAGGFGAAVRRGARVGEGVERLGISRIQRQAV
jgi:hypothetical protein